MAIRLWPQDYERKDHISRAEKGILRYAARNFQDGHIAIGIDPVGLASEKVKMGLYISPNEGLLTFSIYTGQIATAAIYAYISYVEMVENKIHERLLDSKMLIIRNGNKKALKFPYKHIVIFPEESAGKITVPKDILVQLSNYAAIESFRPVVSDGKEKRIEDLRMFDGIRKPYDKTFKSITELECQAVFERLAPEYTVVMNESMNVEIAEKKTFVTDEDLRISGKEVEYKTFFLDEYQVGVVNEMGKGHRVILANPGAGKSVLLLSKAFKYASLYKDSKVLLTCYNSNLADSYNFKRDCANFGDNKNLYIMTFHKLVKKIYEECLNSHCESNIATDEEIQKCIDMIKAGKVKLRFKAIFIDEVQIFDALYLELCYRLLEDDGDRVFLMAGDLNQAVRASSRKGDVPWKRMNGIQLDFTGRVRYIEKNYRNSKEIGEYISHMLMHMNSRLSMLDLINSLEYEYNSFKIGTNPTVALKVLTGINRNFIKNSVITAIKEIATTYRISYSDIAVLFPFRKVPYHKYHFLYWLQQGLDEEGINYSMIINDNDGFPNKKKQGDITGVVISTIESSLGLDFKAVILAGLFPYNYVNNNGLVGKEIKTWAGIKNMAEEEQNAVQSQMRAIYTACSRARDILYVLSDMKKGSPMEEILKQNIDSIPQTQKQENTDTERSCKEKKVGQSSLANEVATREKETNEVVNHATVKAQILEIKKPVVLIVDVDKYPVQKEIIGKKVGETFKLGSVSNTYKIEKIYVKETKENENPKGLAIKKSKESSSAKNVKEFFRSKGFDVIDCRGDKGCLWVIGEKHSLEPFVLEAKKLFGVTGAYGSGKATSQKPGWWTKDNK